MALQDYGDYEDDYVILSDIESDLPGASHSSTFQKHHYTPSSYNTPGTASSSRNTTNTITAALQPPEQSDTDSDLDLDIEEIEYDYGPDNDTLLIMPAMLRDYSHHATNYHPELWRSPIPGSYQAPSMARCRQEDRMLDRAELLKTTIPPTTCGICFESFTTFDLELREAPQEEISTRAQFALSFAARLARSFAPLLYDRGNTQHQHNIPVSSSSGSGSSGSGTSVVATSSTSSDTTSPNRRLSMSPSIRTDFTGPSPSVSSRDIGLVMPCQHGLCLSCLQTFLSNSTENPQARFPIVCPQPGCRTPIPAESAELVLDATTLEIWYRKLAEIHVANKVCCPQPNCRSIIDLDDKDGTAVTCPECKSSFCASCAVPFHRGLSCEEYRAQAQVGDTEEDRAMLQLVKDRHWRHCPSCRFVIEKQVGCNHMVCHCGQSFCYACGYAWDEMEARCSRDCESEGIHEDISLDCIIM
ncbi:hypothetical protein BG006_002654 [Podila minutissima]|uniref:RBR-type E3 ubiquitin transferase n=1 Tax=Podila minutissima TaxID=64525 RepID=A0A9P5SN38_9FUNG|nr:hypothetical protein BG006_002654 [Podila minutissima]